MNFLFQYTSSTTYYSQANGPVESINKVIGALVIKFKNKKWNDLDKHLHIVLYAYQTTFKVTTSHTPF
jgi:plasmid rolling circle replication initiator protein Rep